MHTQTCGWLRTAIVPFNNAGCIGWVNAATVLVFSLGFLAGGESMSAAFSPLTGLTGEAESLDMLVFT